jgi:hypothetical protein
MTHAGADESRGSPLAAWAKAEGEAKQSTERRRREKWRAIEQTGGWIDGEGERCDERKRGRAESGVEDGVVG